MRDADDFCALAVHRPKSAARQLSKMIVRGRAAQSPHRWYPPPFVSETGFLLLSRPWNEGWSIRHHQLRTRRLWNASANTFDARHVHDVELRDPRGNWRMQIELVHNPQGIPGWLGFAIRMSGPYAFASPGRDGWRSWWNPNSGIRPVSAALALLGCAFDLIGRERDVGHDRARWEARLGDECPVPDDVSFTGEF